MNTATGQKKALKMTILYDNYVYSEGTRADWGFSCFIEGTEKNILFDTGTNPEILMHNMKELEVDANDIDLIVLSHNHLDHTGGLPGILDENHDVKIFLTNSFPEGYIGRLRERVKEVEVVNDVTEICRDVYSTGSMGNKIKEQSLLINTRKGPIVITGCSHQGVVNILQKAKEVFPEPVYLIFGGYHLMDKSYEEIERIIVQFKKYGVKHCGPTHCTGEKAIKLFKDMYGENYVRMGTGRVLEFYEN